jgi:hypothetical protein
MIPRTIRIGTGTGNPAEPVEELGFAAVFG